MLLTKEDLLYTICVVSDITESNGPSPMATVCGGSLSMMDAGVPITRPVSGITREIFEAALHQTKDGRAHIVGEMTKVLGSARTGRPSGDRGPRRDGGGDRAPPLP